ncbi:MogA/MoaB family molybdenum cofactor biosynthesis protein [Deinococcus sp. PESE-38]
MRAAVMTISDTRTPDTDESGRYLAEQLTASGHELVERLIVRDDAVEIRSAVVQLMRVADVVLTSGGTGIAGRDVTVPVIESLLVKPIPGFGELFRMLSYGQVRGAAMLSRALGGMGRGHWCSPSPAAWAPCRRPGKASCAMNSGTSSTRWCARVSPRPARQRPFLHPPRVRRSLPTCRAPTARRAGHAAASSPRQRLGWAPTRRGPGHGGRSPTRRQARAPQPAPQHLRAHPFGAAQRHGAHPRRRGTLNPVCLPWLCYKSAA